MTDRIPTGVPTRPGPRPRVDIPHPRLSPGLRSYFATEGAATLLLAAWANVAGDSYHDLWETPVKLMVGTWELNLSLHHWVNDFLMAVFFLVVSVEVNRELTVGELRSFRAASVPLFGAIGGLAVPIGLYLLLNPSGPDAAGWGLPMSTDTAFVIGVLALVGLLRQAMVHPGTYRAAGPESFGPGSMPTRPCRARYASQPKARAQLPVSVAHEWLAITAGDSSPATRTQQIQSRRAQLGPDSSFEAAVASSLSAGLSPEKPR